MRTWLVSYSDASLILINSERLGRDRDERVDRRVHGGNAEGGDILQHQVLGVLT